MEHVDTLLLKELAKLCGWKKEGNQWMCPDCVERIRRGRTKRPRQRSQGTSLEV
jgi:hypothetical protein